MQEKSQLLRDRENKFKSYEYSRHELPDTNGDWN